MSDLIDQARLPETETAVYIDNFNELIKKAPPADLNIFGLVPNPDFEFMKKMVVIHTKLSQISLCSIFETNPRFPG